MSLIQSIKKMIFGDTIDAPNKTPIIVIDVGCRWGFAERFTHESAWGDFKVFGFDPDKEECERLQDSYKDLPDGYVNCIPLALAGNKGERDLYLTKNPACSSLHKPIEFLTTNYPAMYNHTLKQVSKVEVTTLADWAEENNIKTIDYIKLDTQGSELEILKAAEELIKTTRCIDIEVSFNPMYENQSLFGETDTYLRSLGFSLWRISNIVYYSHSAKSIPLEESNSIHFDDNHKYETPAHGGQIFWADARYIHNNVFDENRSPEQNQRDQKLFSRLGMIDIAAVN